MAEYYISYKELEKLIDQYIEDSIDIDQLAEHKAEILAFQVKYWRMNKSIVMNVFCHLEEFHIPY